jgi:magnesium-transporting ATPase (P-type)
MTDPMNSYQEFKRDVRQLAETAGFLILIGVAVVALVGTLIVTPAVWSVLGAGWGLLTLVLGVGFVAVCIFALSR